MKTGNDVFDVVRNPLEIEFSSQTIREILLETRSPLVGNETELFTGSAVLIYHRMTLSSNLDVNRHDRMFEWVSEAADETGVDEKTIWNMAEKLLLEPESMGEMKTELRLKVLYELHLNRWTDTDENPPATWVNVYFSSGEEVQQLGFSFGSFELHIPESDEQMEMIKKITREEGLEVEHIDSDHIVTRKVDCDSVWAVQITKRILDEVYGASIGDITEAEEEVSGGSNLTWNDVPEYR